jgi:hypothetical protein
MLGGLFLEVPGIYRFCHLSYSSPSILFFGLHKILSQEETQQGDPLGPLSFRLTVQLLLLSLSSCLSFGYMDDFTLGGPEAVVAKDVQMVAEVREHKGLHLNAAKRETIHLN